MHPDFSLRNPNKARALVNAFAGNLCRFHAADGAGYHWLADRILEVRRWTRPRARAHMRARTHTRTVRKQFLFSSRKLAHRLIGPRILSWSRQYASVVLTVYPSAYSTFNPLLITFLPYPLPRLVTSSLPTLHTSHLPALVLPAASATSEFLGRSTVTVLRA
jgi:hypothetical protein